MSDLKEKLTRHDDPDDPDDLPLSSFIFLFFFTCWLSLLPASTFGYFFFIIYNPIDIFNTTSNLLYSVSDIMIGLILMYLILIMSSWLVAKASIHIITRGKPIPEGIFNNSYSDPQWQNFTKRHVVKEFSMWFFKRFTPRWLYRKYIGSFIKIGKHVETPRWVAMEAAEIGDNTVFARQTVLSSHFINGKKIVLKTTRVGKNCIIDAEDEMNNVCIGPGAEIGDNVIIKPGTFIGKDTKLESGGIYQGKVKIKKVGNYDDLTPDELKKYRKLVRRKNKVRSKMREEIATFSTKTPKAIKFSAIIFGILGALGVIDCWVYYLIPFLVDVLGVIGHLVNIALSPFLFILAHGFQVYLPLLIFYFGIWHYEKKIPKVDLENAPDQVFTISDPSLIDAWKALKWLKFSALDLVRYSLYQETFMFIFQHMGENEVAFKSLFAVADVDPDNVIVGDNTLISFETQVYAYNLINEKPQKLVIKRTRIGKNCIIGGGSRIHAGANIGDNVMIGYYTVVPEDAILEPGETYVGNPAVKLKEYMKARKKQ
ncbi:MAG: hypothetical protein ACTSYS_02015 [Promethearchaeota archaeon]